MDPCLLLAKLVKSKAQLIMRNEMIITFEVTSIELSTGFEPQVGLILRNAGKNKA